MKKFEEKTMLFELHKLNNKLDKIGLQIQPNEHTVYDKKYKRNLIKGFSKTVKCYVEFIKNIEKLEVK